jgi:putative transposase
VKAFKYRITPTEEQIKKFERTLDLCRFLYNCALEERITAYKRTRKSVACFDQINQLEKVKMEFPEFREVHSQVLQDVLRRLDKSFRAFFGRIKRGGKPGFPKFKGKYSYNSFSYPQSGFELKIGGLQLSKLGLVKIKYHREIEGKIKTCSVIRDVDRWYVCFSCQPDRVVIKKSIRSAVGIDVGLESFATLSDGTKIDNPRWLKRSEKKLTREQKRLSRRVKGSNNRNKQRTIVARTHRRIREQRDDFLHKLSRKLVNKYDLIFYENLQIRNMVRNHHLAKSISDVAWARFSQFLRYKAEDGGGYALPVLAQGTSQECHNCGYINRGLTLWDREWDCPECGTHHDRDHNAAINILRRGFEEYGRNLSEFTPVEIEPLRAPWGFASSVIEAGSPSPLGGG